MLSCPNSRPPIGKTLRGELDWIVMKALEKDRNRRYESASALAADTQRYLGDEPVHAGPPSTLYRLRKFARKHKPAFATALVMAASLILGTAVSARQAVRATHAEAQANANEAHAEEAAAAEAQQRQRAEANEQKANTQRDLAQRQRDEVKALAEKLAAKEQQLQRTLYAAHINLAHSDWNAGGLRRVNGLLEQHRPKLGESDLRGFEWHYLYKLCHPELVAVTRNGGGVAFSPDGKRLACGDKSWDQSKKAFGAAEVKVCDALTGQELLRWKGPTGSLAFSPDGKRLASAGGEELKVWDSQSGKEVFDLKGHTGGLACVAYSPDGRRLASGSSAWALRQDKSVRVPSQVKIWDAMTGKELVSTKSHDASVLCVAFSPDCKRLASGSYDGTVKVWDVHNGQELVTFKAHTEEVMSIAFGPDGKRLVSGGFQGVKVWDTQTGQEVLRVKGAKGQVNSVAYSPDGVRLASVGEGNRVVRVWDAQTGDEIVSFKGHTGWVLNLAFGPQGTRLASTGNGDGTVRIWDVSIRQEANKFSGANFRRRSVGLRPDGKRVTGTATEPVTRGSRSRPGSAWVFRSRCAMPNDTVQQPGRRAGLHTFERAQGQPGLLQRLVRRLPQ
jgi:Tol biopolymer transport system component